MNHQQMESSRSAAQLFPLPALLQAQALATRVRSTKKKNENFHPAPSHLTLPHPPQPTMLAAAKISSRAVGQKGIVGHAATSLVSAVGTSVTCATCSCPIPSCKCRSSSQRRHADMSATTSTTTRSYSSSSTLRAPADTIASIEKSFPGAVPNSTLIATIQSKLSPHGYQSSNTLVATSLCADEVNRTLEKDLADAYDMVSCRSVMGLVVFKTRGCMCRIVRIE